MARILEEDGLFLVWSENFFFLTWKLGNKDCANGSTIRSSNFNFRKKEDSYFQVGVNWMGEIYLSVHNLPSFEKGLFEFFITDAENKIINSKITSSFNLAWPLSMSFTHIGGKLAALNSSFPILITCVLKTSNDSLSKMANEVVVNSFRLRNLKELSSDLKEALDQNMNAEVCLKIGEESIKASKMILRARSPVFDKMFCNESLENINNEVLISDIKAKTVERLVNYLYTATVEECDLQDTLELYCAADKYEVLSLRDHCKEQLLGLLDEDNACSLFSVAHRHCDKGFMIRLVRYVSDDFESVADSDSFAELSSDEMIELTRSVLTVQSRRKRKKAMNAIKNSQM